MSTHDVRHMVFGVMFAGALSVLGQVASGGQQSTGVPTPAAGQAQGRGGTPEAARPDNADSLAHLAAARTIVADDPWLRLPYEFYCVAGNARGNNAQAPQLEPVKIFDNLYAIGHTETTVYAITTPEGIILLDSGYADRVQTVIVAALRQLDLDPDDVKYILLGHGHGDHLGGSSYFQERHGTRVGTTVEDWDVIWPPGADPAREGQARPRRDLVLAEGTPVTLGDTTVTVVHIPGHTPGGLAFIFPVRDGGQTHMAGLFGGTILTTNRISTPGLKQYVESIGHFVDIARQMKVDVEIQNHPIFDGMRDRLAMLETRTANAPHPFVVGAERYAKFWNVISTCIQAEIARRGDD